MVAAGKTTQQHRPIGASFHVQALHLLVEALAGDAETPGRARAAAAVLVEGAVTM